MTAQKYCLGFVFNQDLTKVLMLKMLKLYPGKLNGVGGKIKDGESPEWSMYRELYEETRMASNDVFVFKKVVTLTFSDGIELHVFGTRLKGSRASAWDPWYPNNLGPEGHTLDWYHVDLLDDRLFELAGDGNVPYLVQLALRTLQRETIKETPMGAVLVPTTDYEDVKKSFDGLGITYTEREVTFHKMLVLGRVLHVFNLDGAFMHSIPIGAETGRIQCTESNISEIPKESE